jgi:hypothetical protein
LYELSSELVPSTEDVAIESGKACHTPLFDTVNSSLLLIGRERSLISIMRRNGSKRHQLIGKQTHGIFDLMVWYSPARSKMRSAHEQRAAAVGDAV